ncbi:MAG: phosphotriesterase [Gammaproteobacteria bacterium]|nr:phosphotriesterase [Gammaproteobacteria bacterium]MCP5198530.1 phosphotriesterase [Gammaproteobacteria bacterium]
MPLTRINTTTGTATPEELGCTLIHEHVMVGYPGWELDGKAPRFKRADAMSRALDQMQELKDHGLGTFVDPCPMDLGRDVEFLAELSQKSGMRIVCTTGAYFEAQGNTFTFKQVPLEEITEIYIKEIEDGIGDTGIHAGAIKIATGHRVVSEYEQKLVTAAARAAKATGAPIISHTEGATCGHDQIDLVTGEGVPVDQLLVGHSDGTTDQWYQRALAERGAYVGFDRFGIEMFQPDDVRIEGVLNLVNNGHLERVMMSHDSIMCWLGRPLPFAQSFEGLLEMLPKWRSTHIFREIVPKLKAAGLSQAQIDTILIDNPKRLFARGLGGGCC